MQGLRRYHNTILEKYNGKNIFALPVLFQLDIVKHNRYKMITGKYKIAQLINIMCQLH